MFALANRQKTSFERITYLHKYLTSRVHTYFRYVQHASFISRLPLPPISHNKYYYYYPMPMLRCHDNHHTNLELALHTNATTNTITKLNISTTSATSLSTSCHERVLGSKNNATACIVVFTMGKDSNNGDKMLRFFLLLQFCV